MKCSQQKLKQTLWIASPAQMNFTQPRISQLQHTAEDNAIHTISQTSDELGDGGVGGWLHMNDEILFVLRYTKQNNARYLLLEKTEAVILRQRGEHLHLFQHYTYPGKQERLPRFTCAHEQNTLPFVTTATFQSQEHYEKQTEKCLTLLSENL